MQPFPHLRVSGARPLASGFLVPDQCRCASALDLVRPDCALAAPSTPYALRHDSPQPLPVGRSTAHRLGRSPSDYPYSRGLVTGALVSLVDVAPKSSSSPLLGALLIGAEPLHTSPRSLLLSLP